MNTNVIKLSELTNREQVLLLETPFTCSPVTVGEVLDELEFYRRKIVDDYTSLRYKLFTSTEYQADIRALGMIMDAVEREYECYMHEDWDDDVRCCITDEDLKQAQAIIDRILDKAGRLTYIEDKEVIFDL